MASAMSPRLSTTSVSSVDMEEGEQQQILSLQKQLKNNDKIAGPIRKVHLKFLTVFVASLLAFFSAWWTLANVQSLNPTNENFLNLYGYTYYQHYWSPGYEEKRQARDGDWYFKTEFTNWFGYYNGITEWDDAAPYRSGNSARYYRRPVTYVYRSSFAPPPPRRVVVTTVRRAPPPPPPRRVIVTTVRRAPPPPPPRRVVTTTTTFH